MNISLDDASSVITWNVRGKKTCASSFFFSFWTEFLILPFYFYSLGFFFFQVEAVMKESHS